MNENILIIKNKKYKLSPCKGWDSLEYDRLENELKAEGKLPTEGQLIKDITPEQSNNQFMLWVKNINNSLKATWVDLPFYKKIFFLKYLKFTKNQFGFLLKYMSIKDIYPTHEYICIELNGYKKKVIPVSQESQSDEKLQKD